MIACSAVDNCLAAQAWRLDSIYKSECSVTAWVPRIVSEKADHHKSTVQQWGYKRNEKCKWIQADMYHLVLENSVSYRSSSFFVQYYKNKQHPVLSENGGTDKVSK